MAKQKHVHKYRRHRHKSGNIIFFCALPDCTSKINPALALGKQSICWRCGNAFILSEYAIRLAKPHCDACHKPKGEVDKSIAPWIGPSTGEAHKEIQELVTLIEKQKELDTLDRIADTLQSPIITEITEPEIVQQSQAIESGLRSRLSHLVKPDDEDI